MTDTSPRPEGDDLVRIDGTAIPAFVSVGHDAEGRAIARRTGRVLDWLATLFRTRPSTTLYVAGPADWDRVAAIPLYGMPHAVADRVVTSTTPAPFWRDYTDRIEPHLTEADRTRLRAVYGDPPDLGGRFADLVIAHELTHLFHDFDEATGETDFPRLWLAELFANIGLYGYVAEREPDQLAVLETICELSVAAGPELWPVRALNRMGDGLTEGPLNYIWFEFLLILVARRIWQAGAADAFTAFRDTLRDRTLSDERILARLANIHPDVAAAAQRWPA